MFQAPNTRRYTYLEVCLVRKMMESKKFFFYRMGRAVARGSPLPPPLNTREG